VVVTSVMLPLLFDLFMFPLVQILSCMGMQVLMQMDCNNMNMS
jgi:hypothetical protein